MDDNRNVAIEKGRFPDLIPSLNAKSRYVPALSLLATTAADWIVTPTINASLHLLLNVMAHGWHSKTWSPRNAAPRVGFKPTINSISPRASAASPTGKARFAEYSLWPDKT